MYKITRGLLLFLIVFFLSSCDPKRPLQTTIPALSAKNQIFNVVEMAIIGSGPAGLTAAIYAARANRRVAVFHGDKPGGLLTQTTHVENWPGFRTILGPDLIDTIQEQAEKLGAQFVADSIIAIDSSVYPYRLITEGGTEIRAFSIIIATGASPAILNIPGEQTYWGRGVTTCAVCDAPFYKGEEVVVVGGGDSAAEEAMQLAPYASHVTILVRKESMRAAARMQDLLRSYPNITILFNQEVLEVQGDDHHMTQIVVKNNVTHTVEKRAARGLFLAIGHIPNSHLLKKIVSMDEQGYILLEKGTQATSLPGIFAAGDICDNRYRQAIHAAGQGCAAALDADAFLHQQNIRIDQDAILKNRAFSSQMIDSLPLRTAGSLPELQQIIKDFPGPIIIDFYTDPCPSCKAMLPNIEKIAFAYQNKILFLKVHADHARDISEHYMVLKVPTLLILKKGVEIGRVQEFLSQSELFTLVESTLD